MNINTNSSGMRNANGVGGFYHTVGLKLDVTGVAVGSNCARQLNVGLWNLITFCIE